MKFPTIILSLAPLTLASCSSGAAGDSAPSPTASSGPQGTTPMAQTKGPFAVSAYGTFDEPWAIAFAPGTQTLFVTERGGTMKFVDLTAGRRGTVTGLPRVDYGGQGGLGDVAFLPSEASATLDRRTIYLTWAEAGADDTRGAAMGRGTLVCEEADACRVEGLKVIWRQVPKVTGSGHYSHKIAFSPDGQHLFLSSGERQKGDPAQSLTTNLGKVLRLNLDGTPAEGNPFASRGGVSREIWSLGHRNLLGLSFDQDGQLWEMEHGPRGGDEINRIARGDNYGWPIRSNGSNYNGSNIPDHTADDGFHKPAISWDPVIGPGDFVFSSGKLWPQWRNQALIAALTVGSLVRVRFDGDKGTEQARTDFGQRLRDIAEGPDGSLWVIEDGDGGRLLRLRPAT